MTLAPSTRITASGMCATILQTGIPGKWQFARGIHITSEYTGQCLTCLRANKPALYDGRHLVSPRHSDGIARDVHIDQIGICLDQSLYQLILTIGQAISLTVVALAVLIITLV